MKKHIKRGVWSWLFTLIIIALLVFIVRDIDFLKIYEVLQKTHPVFFVLAVLSTAAALLIANLRWKLYFKGILNVGFWSLLVYFFGGTFFNTVTPGKAVGGEVARAYFLEKKYNKPKSKLLAPIIADKSVYLVILFILTFLSLIYSFIFFNFNAATEVFFTILLVFLFFILSMVFYFFIKHKSINLKGLFGFFFRFKRIKQKFKSRRAYDQFIKKKIGEFNRAYAKIVYDRTLIYKGIFLSLLYWFLTFLTAFFLFLGFGFSISFLHIAVVFIISYFIGDISPIPGGIGLTEGAMFLMYSNIGISRELSILVVLLNAFIYYFFSLLVGGLCWLYLRYTFNWKKQENKK